MAMSNSSQLPLVSVIIPMYNAEKYVSDALESVLTQSYSNIEVIVINDGSTDNSLCIVEAFELKDKRVKIFSQNNMGQSAAANAGFGKSQGELIKFFDADDILSVDVIKNQVNRLYGKDFHYVSYMDYTRFYNDDINSSYKPIGYKLIDNDCTPEEYITFHGTPQMYQCSIWMFYRKLLELSGLWDERLSLINDTEFIPRVLRYASNLLHAPQCNLFYRTNFNSGTLSQVVSSASIKSAILSIDLMASHVRSFISNPTIESIIAQSYVQIFEMAYPGQIKWSKIIERRLKKFSANQYTLGKSGKWFQVVSTLFGWKFTKNLQYWYYKFRY